jgi:hypothetical protein
VRRRTSVADLAEDDRIVAAVDLIGRTGATALEVGYLHDDVPSDEAAWWASAQYQGAKVAVEGKRSPHGALDALLARLLYGGVCRWCGRHVTNRKAKSPQRFCRYVRHGDRYERGCADTHHETTVPAPAWARGGAGG